MKKKLKMKRFKFKKIGLFHSLVIFVSICFIYQSFTIASGRANIGYQFSSEGTATIMTATLQTLPNDNDWYNGDVTVHFDAFNDEVGLKLVTPDHVFTQEGEGLTFTGIAIDNADVVSSYTVSGVNIDKTAPEITVTGITDGAVYEKGKVPEYGYIADDSLSGLDNDWDDVSVVSQPGTDREVYIYTVIAVDKAGNRATKIYHYTVGSDFTPPQITGGPTTTANAYGWFNSDVIIHFDASDKESGIKSVTSDVKLDQECVGMSIKGAAVDNSNNSSDYVVSNINIDKTAPSISVSGIEDGAVYQIGAVPAASFIATDSLSSIDTSSADYATGFREKGDVSYVVTAKDKAGNEAIKTVTYKAVYDFTWHAPLSKKEKYRLGKKIPVEFSLADANGKRATTTYATLIVKAIVDDQPGEIVLSLNDIFVLKGRKYVYELDTKQLSKGEWQIGVETDDGFIQTRDIILK